LDRKRKSNPPFEKKHCIGSAFFFAEKKENLRLLNLDFMDIVKGEIHYLRLL